MSWRLQDWVRPEVQQLNAYHVPDQSGLTKLDAMENPYGWPDSLIEEWMEEMRVAGAAINRYPDASSAALRKRIVEVMSVPEGLDVLLGNGSDELIQLLALATAMAGASVAAPTPGFVVYELVARFTGMAFCGIDLDDDFDLDVEAMQQVFREHHPALLFLALPNNPTGNLFSEERLRAVIQAAPGLVVLDEAYTAFTDADFLPWVLEYPNVVLMRTLSKVGLAGLRLGMLIGRSDLLAEVNKLRLPYNINLLTQTSALFALDHFEVFREQAARLRAERAQLDISLGAIAGLHVWPSEANFLLIRSEEVTAEELFDALWDDGILVKNLHGAHPKLDQCLRLTVGTAEQNSRMIDSIRRCLSER